MLERFTIAFQSTMLMGDLAKCGPCIGDIRGAALLAAVLSDHVATITVQQSPDKFFGITMDMEEIA